MGQVDSAFTDTAGLYKIWKIEKSVWIEGLATMETTVLPSALICSPHPMPTQRFDTLLKLAKNAAPFESVEFTDQHFINLGQSVVITYRAIAKHKRYRQKYFAECMTTYVRSAGSLKIAGHMHVKVPKF